ncbi:hypothetical protein [Variovorax boronicumulans]|uniref:hypothetical protein n=1 Tax=Variovorax boronicumulans TaxID=436515 RepID=UPI0012E40A98|nr:hypothetical protein [Variovorax boronicumulans]GER21296.1 hypothetical protein VCH24_63430 [Variovorax boronicumulans]
MLAPNFSDVAVRPFPKVRLSIVGRPAAEHDERVRAYRAKLAATTRTEWGYRMADRSEHHNHGAQHFAALQVLQTELDPDGSIWREYMPEGFDIPQPRVGGAA